MDSEGLAFPYLEAVDKTGLGVRVMPIGVVPFGMHPWDKVPHVFMTALKMRFINVVCIPPGVALGATISTAQFGNSQGGDGVAYEPAMAIPGLYTVGVPNVAILEGTNIMVDKEIESLKVYDAVICPTGEGAQKLVSHGIKAVQIGPDPTLLARLFSGMNPI